MNISFSPLTTEQAEQIASWRYEEPYHVYDYRDHPVDDTVRYLADPTSSVFAVLQDGELIGFRSFGPDGQVPSGQYEEGWLDTGGGLRPDLTGKGMGEQILREGIEFGMREFDEKRFRVTIADFNERALTVCKRVGFREYREFTRGDGVGFIILVLDYQAVDR